MRYRRSVKLGPGLRLNASKRGMSLTFGPRVEACFVTPTWSEQISGHWNDRWDLTIASVGITRRRMTRLYYTKPYSADAERFFVRKRSKVSSVQQLSGKRLGGCGGCLAQYYIQRSRCGEKVDFLVDHATFVGYDVERNGLADVARGKLDSFLCGVALGRRRSQKACPSRPSAAISTSRTCPGPSTASPAEGRAFIAKVDAIIARLHATGTLRRLPLKHFGTDFATRSGLRRRPSRPEGHVS